MPPVASTTAREAIDHGPRRGIAGLAQLKAGDRAVLGQQRFGDKAFDHADRRRAAHGLDQRRDDRRAAPCRRAHARCAAPNARLRGRRRACLRGRGRTARRRRADRECARPASRAMPSATASSTMPPPTAMVSAACASGLSPSATAAAMPPCAHADDAPCPSGAAEISVTGRGASFSAQNRPARPPPTMTTSSVAAGEVVDVVVSCHALNSSD